MRITRDQVYLLIVALILFGVLIYVDANLSNWGTR